MIRVVLLLALTAPCVYSAACEIGWSEFNGYCFAFYNDQTTWFTAVAFCDTIGARLVYIDTQAKNSWISSQIKNMRGANFWIGGSDSLLEGSWQWLPSKKPFANYLNWGTNQPDNYERSENCVVIMNDNNYKWNDLNCNTVLNFICEKKKL